MLSLKFTFEDISSIIKTRKEKRIDLNTPIFNYKDYDPVDLCSLLYKNSVLMVGYGKFRKQNFIRLVIINAQNTIKEIENFFSTLEDFCKKNNNKIKRKN